MDGQAKRLIPGGYILLSRKIIESEIMIRPPLHLKLWVWFLLRASFRDTPTLKRGQLIASIQEMREAMAYYIGYRKKMPSKKEIRDAYEGLTKVRMVGTMKVTGGLKITILNYDKYQAPKNYEGHSEGHNTGTTRAQQVSKPASAAAISLSKKEKNINTLLLDFEAFWSAYPRKVGKAKAIQTWKKLNGNRPPIEQLLDTLDAQKKSPQWSRDGGQFIPYPATWLNQGRWEDEIPELESQGWNFD